MLKALFVRPSIGKSTVIMHHGLSSVKEEWDPLIEELAKNGLGVFAYDARPAGTPWQKLVDDMGAAVRSLETTYSIDRKKVILAGASLGANVCLKYAALTNNGAAILLLSPGLNYQGLTTTDVAGQIKKTPILIIAHPADGYAFKSSRELTPLIPTGQFWTSTKPGHGVQMFDEDLLRKISSWLNDPK